MLELIVAYFIFVWSITILSVPSIVVLVLVELCILSPIVIPCWIFWKIGKYLIDKYSNKS